MQTPEQRRAWRKTVQNDPVRRAKRNDYLRDYMRRKNGGDPSSTTRPKPANCEVCGLLATGPREMHWDHDHKTGKFRGWLCGSCNRCIGQAKDNPVVLRLLADYLEKV